MVNITAQRGEVEAYVIEAVATSLSDIDTLHETCKGAIAGSTCVCLENSSVWMLGGDGIWHEL